MISLSFMHVCVYVCIQIDAIDILVQLVHLSAYVCMYVCMYERSSTLLIDSKPRFHVFEVVCVGTRVILIVLRRPDLHLLTQKGVHIHHEP